jgi:hypothetical protein
MFKLKNRAGHAGRKSYPYQIPNEEMGSIMDKMHRPLREEIRAIAYNVSGLCACLGIWKTNVE